LGFQDRCLVDRQVARKSALEFRGRCLVDRQVAVYYM
jgi:hypothetical protein